MPTRAVALDITAAGVDDVRRRLVQLGEDGDCALRRPAEGARVAAAAFSGFDRSVGSFAG